MEDVSQIRKDYKKFKLDIESTSDNPFEQFNKWMDDALNGGFLEPTAFVLSTVSIDNKPSSRVLLLKGIEPDGYIFYTNYESRKGNELKHNNNAAMLFFWDKFERQVRIEGKIEKINREQSQKYFNSRLKFKEKVLNIFDIDLLIISYGNLSSNKDVGYNYEMFLKEMNINFLSVCSIIYTFIDFFISKKHGKIAVITSVAGVRARYSNYIYGVGKGSLILFLQGLRSNLLESKIQIIDIRPGLVDTPMTKNLKKSFLFASPDRVAKAIVNGINKNKDIIYTPYFWKIVMMVIKLIPEKIFKKLKF